MGELGELGCLQSCLRILVCVPELPFGMGREQWTEAQTVGSASCLPEPFHILLLSPAEEDELDPSWIRRERRNSPLHLRKPVFCSWAAAEGGFEDQDRTLSQLQGCICFQSLWQGCSLRKSINLNQIKLMCCHIYPISLVVLHHVLAYKLHDRVIQGLPADTETNPHVKLPADVLFQLL